MEWTTFYYVINMRKVNRVVVVGRVDKTIKSYKDYIMTHDNSYAASEL